jgi:hypothetical protein
VKFIALLLMLCASSAYAQDAAHVVRIGTSAAVPSVTIASLPTCNAASAGNVYLVTNALTPVIGSSVVAGGAISVLVRCNGTNWLVGQ